jgi:translation initiation factor 1
LPDDPATLQSLATTFKKLCGSGGTVRDSTIEVQGDHRDRLETRLLELGYRVKRVGG